MSHFILKIFSPLFYFFYIISSLITLYTPIKFYQSKFINLNFSYQQFYYDHISQTTPLLIYIISFKSNPFPPQHIITKIIIKIFKSPLY